MSDNDITLSEYREQIDLMASEIVDEYEAEELEDRLAEIVWESVDSHQWIIHYSYNLDVLEHAEHEPQEWKHLVGEDDSWKEVIQAMAYKSMENDLYFEVQDRLDD